MTGTRERRWAWAYAVIALAAAGYQIVALLVAQGTVWPDEIYQSLEQGHRLVFGFGAVPWEFASGARSWVFPGVLGGVLQVARAVAGDDVRLPVLAGRGFMALLSGVTVWLTARLGRRLAGPPAGLWAALLLAAFPGWILFAGRCLSETASAPLLLAAVLLLLPAPDRGARGRAAFAAGVLVATACLLRYQNGIVLLGLLAWLAFERRADDALRCLAGATGGALAGAVLDWLTWGRPFHSLIAYVDFNLLEGGSSGFGVQPAAFYLAKLWSSAGPAALVVGVLMLRGGRRAPALLLLVVAYVALHSCVPHKELRFLVAVIPIAMALAGAGIHSEARARVQVRLASAAVVLMAIASLHVRSVNVTIGEIGYTRQPAVSAWRLREPYNRLLWLAARQPDICGLAVAGAPVAIGGHSYFHRDVPLLGAWPLGRDVRDAANFLIAPVHARLPLGYLPVASERGLRLHRRPGGCAAPPPGYGVLARAPGSAAPPIVSADPR